MPYSSSLKLAGSHEFSHFSKSGSNKILPRQISIFGQVRPVRTDEKFAIFFGEDQCQFFSELVEKLLF